MIRLNYPHVSSSLEPKALRKEEVWLVAEVARDQICGANPRPKINLERIVARTKTLQINGLSFETHWELGRDVTDDAGNPVMGSVEHDKSWPNAAMIYLNGELIGDRQDLALSTSGHELGHAVFDAPAWIKCSQGDSRRGAGAPRRLLKRGENSKGKANGTFDWAEWRANEFMGALLAPRHLLHLHMHKRAAALGIPMVGPERGQGLPLVHGGRADFDAIEALATELAEIFGVSIQFAEVRMRKYGLITKQ